MENLLFLGVPILKHIRVCMNIHESLPTLSSMISDAAEVQWRFNIAFHGILVMV